MIAIVASARAALALVLLGVAIGMGVPAQAQEARKPNILVIWGDDIGWYNISAYNLGVMGYRTPNIDRIARGGCAVHRLVRAAELHRRARRLPHRPVADPHRADQGRPARGARGPEQVGPDHRRAAQAAGLRHRPVRQEPSRRPQRAPADGARLRRVLRQPLPPQRRGGAGEHRLPERSRVQGQVRPARRAALLRHRPRGGRRGPALRRLGQAEVRGHRAAHRRADGDGRPRSS